MTYWSSILRSVHARDWPATGCWSRLLGLWPRPWPWSTVSLPRLWYNIWKCINQRGILFVNLRGCPLWWGEGGGCLVGGLLWRWHHREGGLGGYVTVGHHQGSQVTVALTKTVCKRHIVGTMYIRNLQAFCTSSQCLTVYLSTSIQKLMLGYKVISIYRPKCITILILLLIESWNINTNLY